MITDFLLFLFFKEVTSQYDYKFKEEYFQRPTQTAYYQVYDDNNYNWQKENRYLDARRNFPGRGRLKYPEYIDSKHDYARKEAKCKCSCKQCEELKPCCKSICVNCYSGPPGLVVVPYPVPVIVHISSPKIETGENVASTVTMTTTTTTTTTTTSTTTKATTPIETITTSKSTVPYIASAFTEFDIKHYKKCPLINSNCLNENEIYRRDNLYHYTDKQKKFYRDLGIIRPTVPNQNYGINNKRPNWIPKYGIMPIPDEIAMKLMESSERIEP